MLTATQNQRDQQFFIHLEQVVGWVDSYSSPDLLNVLHRSSQHQRMHQPKLMVGGNVVVVPQRGVANERVRPQKAAKSILIRRAGGAFVRLIDDQAG
ncbi:hypothetical protein D3C86_1875200 [compost metagenome]